MSISEQWLLFNDINHSPFFNMAIDEVLMNEVAEMEKPLLRIYGWDRYAISIGYIQNYNAIINEVANEKEEPIIIRRPTGGGVVYHENELTYTVTIPKGHKIESLDTTESYKIIHLAVLKCLNSLDVLGDLQISKSKSVDRGTMQCFITPTKYDVMVNNIKYSGSAQRRTKKGILHQGSIILRKLKDNKATVKTALIAGFEQEFNMKFLNYIPNDSLIKEAESLAQTKYQTKEWNQRR